MKQHGGNFYRIQGALSALLVLVVGIIWIRTISKTVPPPELTAPQTQTTSQARRALDGIIVQPGQENPMLTAVLVENMEDGQPVSGIDKASLVYESLVEAGITRFLAVFPQNTHQDTPIEIGPVRSARPYFLDWTNELGALLAHCGGSPEAVRFIHDNKFLTLDQWFKDAYFWRTSSRNAPHNVYTSFRQLNKSANALIPGSTLEKQSQKLLPWIFKDDTPETGNSIIKSVRIPFPNPYAVLWKYNETDNNYIRNQWGDEHKTKDGGVIKAKNIVVIFQSMEILDTVGRKRFTTIGEGKAVVFRDGTAITGTWKKSDITTRIHFFDSTNNEIPLNAGLTWITVVPKGYSITY